MTAPKGIEKGLGTGKETNLFANTEILTDSSGMIGPIAHCLQMSQLFVDFCRDICAVPQVFRMKMSVQWQLLLLFLNSSK